VQEFSEEEKRKIGFHDITTGEITHWTELDSNFVPNYQSVVGYFAQVIRKELRLVGGHDVLYEKVKKFVTNYLFEQKVDLEDLNILRNLSELETTKTLVETFKKEINELTVVDKGEAEIRDYIKISKTRPFVIKEQGFIVPKKSVFNKIIGDSHFELQFADFLESCDDIISYAKNYFSVHFKIDYKDADGNISNYYPDFFVKISDREMYIVETKGREDLDDVEKIKRLYQWCDDINVAQSKIKFTALYVKQEDFEKYTPKSFGELVKVI
jgi:type III restriction enzyme